MTPPTSDDQVVLSRDTLVNLVVAGESVKPRPFLAWMPHDRRLLSEPAERLVRDT